MERPSARARRLEAARENARSRSCTRSSSSAPRRRSAARTTTTTTTTPRRPWMRCDARRLPSRTRRFEGAFYTLVPIRPRRRGERRSLRTLPVVSLRPGSLAFNPHPRRLSTPTDAFQLHPGFRSKGGPRGSRRRFRGGDGGGGAPRGAVARTADVADVAHRRGRGRSTSRREGLSWGRLREARVERRVDTGQRRHSRRRDEGFFATRGVRCVLHWSPYDRVRVVNADP